jgi:hypothetical protein
MSFWQAGGGPCCDCGAPNGDTPLGAIIPGEPGIPGVSPSCAFAGTTRTSAASAAATSERTQTTEVCRVRMGQSPASHVSGNKQLRSWHGAAQGMAQMSVSLALPDLDK